MVNTLIFMKIMEQCIPKAKASEQKKLLWLSEKLLQAIRKQNEHGDQVIVIHIYKCSELANVLRLGRRL